MKVTQIRKNILDFFRRAKKPVSYDNLISFLKKKKISFNRSTVFRNLNFLVKNNIIYKVNLGDRKVRYELNKKNNHHHHLICQRCNKIIDFYDKRLDEVVLKIEKRLSKKNGFQIKSHQFEFFGFCQDCA